MIRYNDRANTTRLRISEDRICTRRSTIFSAHTVENEEHILNHCDINAVARRNILNKINIITSKSSESTPNSIIHTISPDTNLVNLISNHNDILISLTYKSQIHLSRIVARYITNCFKNRKKFLVSTNADSCCNTWPMIRAINVQVVHLRHSSTILPTKLHSSNKGTLCKLRYTKVYQIKRRYKYSQIPFIFVHTKIIIVERGELNTIYLDSYCCNLRF